jgi:hypothetical protein
MLQSPSQNPFTASLTRQRRLVEKKLIASIAFYFRFRGLVRNKLIATLYFRQNATTEWMFGRRVVTSSFELFSMYHWVRNLEKNKERRAGCFNFNPIVLRNLNSFFIHLKNYPLQILQQPSAINKNQYLS